MSPEIVPTRIMSTSSAFTWARFSACSAARVQRSEKCSPSATMCRSRMPVRLVIQSSEVSTSLSRAAFERIRFGTAAPVPRIFALIMSAGTRNAVSLRFSAHCSCLGQARLARVQLGDLLLNLLSEVLPRELRGEADRVLHRLRRRAAVADDDAALHAEERRAAVFGVVEPLLETPERRLREQ